jgi:hypothetical protein
MRKRSTVSPDVALAEMGLTGTGTADTLTVDLDQGQVVTITKQDVASWPAGVLRSSVVLIGGVPFEVRYAVDLMERARQYFDLVGV